MSNNEELKAAISKLVEGYSIEVTPHDEPKMKDFPGVLPEGTRVYVAHPPGMSLDEVITLAEKLRQLGFSPVPHIIARKLVSREQLERALERLAAAGVDHALCLAGDIVEGDAFASSAEVLQTGLFADYGFRRVAVAGHPEGSAAIGEERLKQALLDKQAIAESAPFELYMATQFGFDAKAFTDWEAQTRAMGITMPVDVGMSGPASIKQLIRFAALCGVGASARMLTTRTGDMASLLGKRAPDDLITAFAKYGLEHPESRFRGIHIFAFGSVVGAGGWANKVIAGEFELNRNATGFKVAG